MNKLLLVLCLALAAAVALADATTITLQAPPAPNGFFDVFVNVTGVFDPPHEQRLRVGIWGPGGFTGPLNLAVLHFSIAGLGPTSISISAKPSNLDQGLIYLSASDAISASTSCQLRPSQKRRDSWP